MQTKDLAQTETAVRDSSQGSASQSGREQETPDEWRRLILAGPLAESPSCFRQEFRGETLARLRASRRERRRTRKCPFADQQHVPSPVRAPYILAFRARCPLPWPQCVMSRAWRRPLLLANFALA